MDIEPLRELVDADSLAFAESVLRLGQGDYARLDATTARQAVARRSWQPTAPAHRVTLRPGDNRKSLPPLTAILYPPGAPAKDPGLLLFMHGGGFVVGNAASADPVCRQLAQRAGCYVLDLDYRLAPEWPFPSAVEDCQLALRWANAHASGWRADRLAVAGSSAGANLAAVTAQLARQPDLPDVCFQLLVCPLLDFRPGAYPSRKALAHTPVLSAEALAWFEARYLPDNDSREDPRASPAAASDLSGLAPALLVVASGDPLRDEAHAYARAMRDAGNRVALEEYPSVHAFMSLFEALPVGRRALDRAIEAVAQSVGREA